MRKSTKIILEVDITKLLTLSLLYVASCQNLLSELPLKYRWLCLNILSLKYKVPMFLFFRFPLDGQIHLSEEQIYLKYGCGDITWTSRGGRTLLRAEHSHLYQWKGFNFGQYSLKQAFSRQTAYVSWVFVLNFEFFHMLLRFFSSMLFLRCIFHYIFCTL